MLYTIESLEPRLQKRYKELVKQHLAATDSIAAGLRSLPGARSAFSCTQAAWRFYANDGVTLQALAQPLIDSARELIYNHSIAYALCIHDWTDLNYSTHSRKQDRIQIRGSRNTLGFQLQTALIISDMDGAPIAPVCQSLWAESGIYTSRSEEVQPYKPQIDELSEAINYLDELGFSKPLVHIIDRGADSVAHYRQWNDSRKLFVVRADRRQRVIHQGEELLLGEVVGTLEFEASRSVDVNGAAGLQFVAETEVTITRAARPHRQRKGVKQARKVIKGEPITLRLIVTQVRAADETLLAEWLLYTNVPSEVRAETLALWYYWRWKIESYFKLLKSAGHNVEQWQQESVLKIGKRLLVASQASVVVWQLARATTPAAQRARDLLVRLSGRQMGRGKEYTEPALLAGMWVLLAMVDALEQYKVSELTSMARTILRGLERVDSS
jgi:hypothetical protein